MGTMHALSGAVGVGLVGAVAHSAIMANGGYDFTSSPPMIGVACGLVVGSIAVGTCFRERRFALGLLLVLGLVAAEAYALIMTAERTLAYREARQAPLKAAAEARAKTATILADAERELAAAGESPRLARALESKRQIDGTVAAKVAEKGCAANCRALLEQQLATAQQEIDEARREWDRTKLAVERKVIEARATLEALPVPGSISPLADRLGVEGWQIDLAAAALASLAANGLGAFLIAFAAHGRRREEVRVIAAPQEITEAQIVSAPQAEIIAGVTLQKREARAEADQFARRAFRPDAAGRVALADIRAAYHSYCRQEGLAPLADHEIGAALNELFTEVGLLIDRSEPRAVVVGIGWSDKVPALAA